MTTHIQVSDTGLEVIPPRDTLTQGSDNTLLCEFEFSGAWQECTEINAVFTDGINSATAPVTANACVIPVDILQNPWRFVSISLNGSNLGGVITSPFVRLGQVLPSAYGGEGGKFVTMAQLQEILLDYVLRAELGEYVTQETLDTALAAYIKASEAQENFDALSSRITANTAAIAANAADIAEKASQSELQALSDTVDGKADESALADYWSKSEIGLQTSGDGKEFLANDGKYYEVQGGGGDEKTFIAEYNVTTAQEIIAYLDASKEPFAPMLVKRGGDYYTVTTASKQAADKVIIVTFASLSGNYYTFTYTITGNTWATASYGFQKLLESGTNIKTINGQSLLGGGDIQIQGGGVTPEELAAALADYLKTADAQATYATLAALQAVQNDVAGKASQADLQALEAVVNGKAAQADVTALQTRVGAAETNITALQSDVSANTAAIADNAAAIATKAAQADLQALQNTVAGKADAATVDALAGTVATNTAAIATNAAAISTNAADIATNAAAIATKAAQADLEALQTAVNGKADASALADYETSAHASATYETKSDASKIKSITAAGFAITPDSAGNVNIGGTMVSRDADSGSWGSEITYQIAQTLPAGATPGTNPTPGASLTIVKRTENSGANPRIRMTIDGVQLATSADIPDVSQFATITYVQMNYETSAHASATYATKTELAEKADETTVTALSATVAANTAAIATKAAASDLQALETTVAGKADASALDDYETSAHAAATYETKADASLIKSISAGGTAVAPDASGNVALTKSVVSYNENSATAAFQGYVQQNDASGNITVLQYSYDNDGEKSTNLRFEVSARQSGGMPSIRGSVRAVTYDELTDSTAGMATQTWVQEYVSSLDGTNIAV